MCDCCMQLRATVAHETSQRRRMFSDEMRFQFPFENVRRQNGQALSRTADAAGPMEIKQKSLVIDVRVVAACISSRRVMCARIHY